MAVKLMESKDIETVICIHLKSFKGFFLTFLGAGFLRILYSFILEYESGIAFVSIRDGSVVGFVAGTDNPFGFYTRAIRAKSLEFCMATLPAVLRRPTIVPRLLRALSKPADAVTFPSDCELMSIAVDSSFYGKGVGLELIEAFCDTALNRGCRNVTLTTDQEGNEGVNAFYERAGFKLDHCYKTREGRPMNYYIRSL